MKKYLSCAETISCGSRASEAHVKKYLLPGAVTNLYGIFIRQERV